jgi:hypothetical protein
MAGGAGDVGGGKGEPAVVGAVQEGAGEKDPPEDGLPHAHMPPPSIMCGM